MPEGDTIHRTARRLSRALLGKTLSRVESTLSEIAAAGLAGRRVELVSARGKHLAIRFDDGRVLLSHMRMVGSWHMYREGERWWRPEHAARVVLRVGAELGDEALVAVCFSAPVVRLVSEQRAEHDLAQLGPDVVATAFDASAAVGSLRRISAASPVGEAILNQNALAGVGNVYKSEVLFAERISPYAPVSSLSDEALAGIVARARALMRRNVAKAAGTRTTTSGGAAGPYAVYRRSGRPCPRCGETIARIVQGAQRRSTYYCPRCQTTGAPAGR